MNLLKTKKTSKCEHCGKRYRLKEWKKGLEYRICFTWYNRHLMIKGFSKAYERYN